MPPIASVPMKVLLLNRQRPLSLHRRNCSICPHCCRWRQRPGSAQLGGERLFPICSARAIHPEVDLHPAAAEARGIKNGDCIFIETPEGSVRARARFSTSLDPRVVVGEHGWWQGVTNLARPGLTLRARKRQFQPADRDGGARSGQRHRLAPLLSLRDLPGVLRKRRSPPGPGARFAFRELSGSVKGSGALKPGRSGVETVPAGPTRRFHPAH